MDPIRLLISRQPVAIFCSVTILLSFAVYLLPLPRAGVPFLMVLIPAIIAMVLTAISEGSAGVHTLWRQTGQWRSARSGLSSPCSLPSSCAWR